MARNVENVKVAVRVRPFNDREKKLGSVLVVSMVGNQTIVSNPKEGTKKTFAFDYSYWSHDGFAERGDGYLEPAEPRYADQMRVFNDLGRGVLDNAWNGFNSCLFAYGQTGSGKSYSIMGYGSNKGIVPVACEMLFSEIEARRSSGSAPSGGSNGASGRRGTRGELAAGAEFQVSVSMLEIYNEQVFDLLGSRDTGRRLALSNDTRAGLRIRNHPQKGFYGAPPLENLSIVPVNSSSEILTKLNDGIRNRSIASTNMNETSSRAHTIFSIQFSQRTQNQLGQSMLRSATIHLVDLAGSERISVSGAEGTTRTEAININKSLTVLGNAIKALVDQSTGKNIVVPYRDSVLTMLLKNALDGNSKTIMLAAISPADVNFDETVSTLRFADRAKALKTRPIVNESPTDRLIRELKEENARLLALLQGRPQTGPRAATSAIGVEADFGMGVGMGVGTGVGTDGYGPGVSVGVGAGLPNALELGGIAAEELESILHRNEDEMARLRLSWEEQLSSAQAEVDRAQAEQRALGEKKARVPHFWNLNEDPSLSGMIHHFLDGGRSKREYLLGNARANGELKPDIPIFGIRILEKHALIKEEPNGTFTITPLNKDGQVLLNGYILSKPTPIHHNDCVMVGANTLLVFSNPREVQQAGADGRNPPTFEEAMDAIHRHRLDETFLEGLRKGRATDREYLLLREELIQVLTQVYEANAMAYELKKEVDYEVVLISPHFRGVRERNTPFIYVKGRTGGREFLWEADEFLSHKVLIQEVHSRIVLGSAGPAYAGIVPPPGAAGDDDPFIESLERPQLLGVARVVLNPLAFLVEIDEALAVITYYNAPIGELGFSAYPSDESGRPIGEEACVEEPRALLGRPFFVRLAIQNVRGLRARYRSVWVRFTFFGDERAFRSEEVPLTSDGNARFEKVLVWSGPDASSFSSTSPLSPPDNGRRNGPTSSSSSTERLFLVNQAFLEYLTNEILVVEVWGVHPDVDTDGSDAGEYSQPAGQHPERVLDSSGLSGPASTRSELEAQLNALRKRAERSEHKLVAELEARLDAPALKAVAKAAIISSHMKLYTQFREERAAGQRPSSSSSGGSRGLAAPPATERGPSAAHRQGVSGNGKGSATVRK